MMLVQKPQSIALSNPALFSHRRHPSAPPAVIVQSTRTPGLLSLSKPVRQTPNRPLVSAQRPHSKSSPKSKSVVRAQVLTPAAEITDTKSVAPTTPSPQSRGRSQAKQAKEKVVNHRSTSQSSIRGKHGRQPSPPILQSQTQPNPSQAEATIQCITSTNHFDPFLDHSSTPPSTPPSVINPSGKLARRRQEQHHQVMQPSPSKAIPVPITRKHISNLSRSDPLPSHMQHPHAIPRRSSTLQEFPICDDVSEVGDFIHLTPPTTPRRHHDNGPRTAPISARAPGAFPFTPLPPVTPSKKINRRHRRTPSEGVFNMSSDEEFSSGSDTTLVNPTVRALFSSASTPFSSKTSSPAFNTPSYFRPAPTFRGQSASPDGSLSKERQADGGVKVAGYYASSLFQNSPSPEELPAL